MKRLIKKYKNRRLYDTETSQYITVEQLQQYVLDGLLFKVEDAQTGADLTSVTLLQAFVEMENQTSHFLSEDILRQLIIAAKHPMNQSFKAILVQAFDTIEKAAAMNPFLKDYEKTAATIQENADVIMKQWQNMFKK